MNRGLTKRAILLTIFVWLCVFSAFTSTAVVLATIRSQPLFALVIIVGLMASTLVADLYVSDTVRMARPLPEPVAVEQAAVLSGTATPSTGQGVRSGVLSEPWVCGAHRSADRKFFSWPSLAVFSAQVPGRLTAPSADQQEGVAHEEEGLRTATEARRNSPEDQSHSTFTCSPMVPASWKIPAANGDSRPGSASGAVSPSRLSSSKNSTLKDSQHRYLYDAFVDYTVEEEEGALEAVSSSLLHGSVLEAGPSGMFERLQELDNFWGTPSPLRAGSPFSPGVPKKDGQKLRSETTDPVGADPQSVFIRVQEDTDVDRDKPEGASVGKHGATNRRKTSKRRFNLLPRFLRGKRDLAHCK